MATGKLSKSLNSCAIAVMGKASVAGRAKTRLVPPLSADDAALCNTAFLQDTVGNVLKAASSAAIEPYVAYGPSGSVQFFRDTLPGVNLIEACWPDFGECLYGTIDELLDAGHQSVGVMNSDSPTLPTRLLVEAATLLSAPGDHAVLGPSSDGGYYFLGLKRAHRELFEAIDWSTASVCQQTRQRAADLGLKVSLLDTWYDVDDAAALRRLYDELLSPGAAEVLSTRYPAPRTRAALLRIAEHTDLLRLGLAPPLDATASA